MTTLQPFHGPVDTPPYPVHYTPMNRIELEAALEKHGLPIWGTDAELAKRWEANQPKAQAPKPSPKPIPQDGNVLLANKVSRDAPLAEAYMQENLNPVVKASIAPEAPFVSEVTSENVHEDKPRETLTAFGSRKPGRPPKVQ